MKKTLKITLLMLALTAFSVNAAIFHLQAKGCVWLINLSAAIFWFCIQLLFLRVFKKRIVRAIPFLAAATAVSLFIIVAYIVGIFAGGADTELFLLTPIILIVARMTQTWWPAWALFLLSNAFIGSALAYAVNYIAEEIKANKEQ